jgi:hypothetical protein
MARKAREPHTGKSYTNILAVKLYEAGAGAVFNRVLNVMRDGPRFTVTFTDLSEIEIPATEWCGDAAIARVVLFAPT